MSVFTQRPGQSRLNIIVLTFPWFDTIYSQDLALISIRCFYHSVQYFFVMGPAVLLLDSIAFTYERLTGTGNPLLLCSLSR